MAFVARRPNGRFEIRESRHTDAGPRARTLATFQVLDDRVLAKAAAAATTPFDRADVLDSACRAGAPIAESSVDAAARRLLLELRAGRILSPGLRRLLADELQQKGDSSIGDWVGASADDRGAALRDLLDLGDRLPPTRRSRLTFPSWRRG